MAKIDDIHTLDPDGSGIIVPPKQTSTEKSKPGGTGKRSKKLMFIIGGIAIAAITAGVAFALLSTRVQKEDVELEFSGPENVKTAEEVIFKIGYANNARITWKNTKLKLTVPAGFEFVSAGLSPSDAENLVWDLGDVAPETEEVIEIHAKFYGDTNATLKVEGALEITPDGFGTAVTETATYEPGVIAPNVTVDLDAPSNTNAGSEITYDVEITNNEKTDYLNSSVKFTYPQGFVVTKTEPVLAEGKEAWEFEKLEPGKVETIKVTGRLDGLTDEKKNIAVQLLTKYKDVDYIQVEASEVTVISSPTVTIKQTVSTQTVKAGDSVRFLLKIKNVGNSPLTNLTLVNVLDSKVIDPASLSIDKGGVLRGSDLVWDNTVLEPLRFLEPNEEFEVGFSLKSYENITPTAKEFSIISKPKITTGTQEVFGDTVMVKIKTDVEITHDASPFDSSKNPVGTGPTTPQVGQTTTYRVSTNIVNRYNTISKGKFVCTIPLGTTYTKNFKVTDGTTLVYDEALKNIIWEIGDMNPKNETETKSQFAGYFDVTISPTAPNLDNEMLLTQNCTFTGRDTFTEEDISVPLEALESEKVE